MSDAEQQPTIAGGFSGRSYPLIEGSRNGVVNPPAFGPTRWLRYFRSSKCPLQILETQPRKDVKRVKPPHLNLMLASDEDAEHTIGCAATLRPTLEHNLVYVAGEILKLRPFYTHEIGAKSFLCIPTSLHPKAHR